MFPKHSSLSWYRLMLWQLYIVDNYWWVLQKLYICVVTCLFFISSKRTLIVFLYYFLWWHITPVFLRKGVGYYLIFFYISGEYITSKPLHKYKSSRITTTSLTIHYIATVDLQVLVENLKMFAGYHLFFSLISQSYYLITILNYTFFLEIHRKIYYKTGNVIIISIYIKYNENEHRKFWCSLQTSLVLFRFSTFDMTFFVKVQVRNASYCFVNKYCLPMHLQRDPYARSIQLNEIFLFALNCPAF